MLQTPSAMRRRPPSRTKSELVEALCARFAPLANAANAKAMAAYMKTDVPFFGIKAGDRRAIVKQTLKDRPITSREDYVAAIKSLWREPQREMKYAAIQV